MDIDSDCSQGNLPLKTSAIVIQKKKQKKKRKQQTHIFSLPKTQINKQNTTQKASNSSAPMIQMKQHPKQTPFNNKASTTKSNKSSHHANTKSSNNPNNKALNDKANNTSSHNAKDKETPLLSSQESFFDSPPLANKNELQNDTYAQLKTLHAFDETDSNKRQPLHEQVQNDDEKVSSNNDSQTQKSDVIRAINNKQASALEHVNVNDNDNGSDDQKDEDSTHNDEELSQVNQIQNVESILEGLENGVEIAADMDTIDEEMPHILAEAMNEDPDIQIHTKKPFFQYSNDYFPDNIIKLFYSNNNTKVQPRWKKEPELLNEALFHTKYPEVKTFIKKAYGADIKTFEYDQLNRVFILETNEIMCNLFTIHNKYSGQKEYTNCNYCYQRVPLINSNAPVCPDCFEADCPLLSPSPTPACSNASDADSDIDMDMDFNIRPNPNCEIVCPAMKCEIIQKQKKKAYLQSLAKVKIPHNVTEKIRMCNHSHKHKLIIIFSFDIEAYYVRCAQHEQFTLCDRIRKGQFMVLPQQVNETDVDLAMLYLRFHPFLKAKNILGKRNQNEKHVYSCNEYCVC